MKKLVQIVLVVALAGATSAYGGVGASWLKIPVGVTSAALGEAAVAHPLGEDAAWLNPAALALLRQSSAGFGHARWIADVRSSAVEAQLVTARGNLLLFGNVLTVPGLERRVIASTAPLGTFDAHQVQAGAGFGRVFGGRLALGVAAKWVYEKIHLVDGGTVALDLGATTVVPTFGLDFGVAVRNLGPGYGLGNDTVELPTVVSAGVSRGMSLWGRPEGLRGWLAWRHIRGEGSHVALGAQVGVVTGLNLRLGYQTGYETRGLSLGVGLHLGRVRFSYALVPFREGFGEAHLASFAYRL